MVAIIYITTAYELRVGPVCESFLVQPTSIEFTVLDALQNLMYNSNQSSCFPPQNKTLRESLKAYIYETLPALSSPNAINSGLSFAFHQCMVCSRYICMFCLTNCFTAFIFSSCTRNSRQVILSLLDPCLRPCEVSHLRRRRMYSSTFLEAS